MRDWLIRLLGGYTIHDLIRQSEFDELFNKHRMQSAKLDGEREGQHKMFENIVSQKKRKMVSVYLADDGYEYKLSAKKIGVK